MKLPIVYYGHPVLRQKGARIAEKTPELVQLIENMIETMYDAHGVGLAAQQIGQAVQLTVIDVAGVTDRPSTIEWDGKPARIEEHMPLVLINPELNLQGAKVAGPEGCLSFPEIYADIERPEFVEVRALDKDLKPIHFRCGGLLARAVQHETDHLNGILFIDRMDAKTKAGVKDELEILQAETKAALKKK